MTRQGCEARYRWLCAARNVLLDREDDGAITQWQRERLLQIELELNVIGERIAAREREEWEKSETFQRLCALEKKILAALGNST